MARRKAAPVVHMAMCHLRFGLFYMCNLASEYVLISGRVQESLSKCCRACCNHMVLFTLQITWTVHHFDTASVGRSHVTSDTAFWDQRMC